MIRSQEALLEQQSSAVVNKDLAGSLHQSLEALVGPEMEKVYRGMQRFDATMVCRSKSIIPFMLETC